MLASPWLVGGILLTASGAGLFLLQISNWTAERENSNLSVPVGEKPADTALESSIPRDCIAQWFRNVKTIHRTVEWPEGFDEKIKKLLAISCIEEARKQPDLIITIGAGTKLTIDTIWGTLAMSGKDAAGYMVMAINTTAGRAHVPSLAVHPFVSRWLRAAKTKSLGRTLLEDMFGQAAAEGIEFVTIDVDKDNEPALKLYRRFGREAYPLISRRSFVQYIPVRDSMLKFSKIALQYDLRYPSDDSRDGGKEKDLALLLEKLQILPFPKELFSDPVLRRFLIQQIDFYCGLRKLPYNFFLKMTCASRYWR